MKNNLNPKKAPKKYQFSIISYSHLSKLISFAQLIIKKGFVLFYVKFFMVQSWSIHLKSIIIRNGSFPCSGVQELQVDESNIFLCCKKRKWSYKNVHNFIRIEIRKTAHIQLVSCSKTAEIVYYQNCPNMIDWKN